MDIFKTSLAFRLTVWFLLLSMLPLSVVAIFVLNDVSAGFDELTLHHQRDQTEFLAEILSRYPASEVASVLSENPDQNDTIFVVSPNGQYLLHPNENKIAASINDDFSQEVVQSALDGNIGATIETGTGQVVGFAPIPNQDSIVVIVTDKSPAIALISAIRHSAQLQLAASLVIMSIAGGVAIWLVVGSPVRQLTRVAKQVSQGNLDVEVDPEDTTDELQVLAFTFNQMIGQLRNLISGLEQKVVELEEAEQAIRASEEYSRALIEYAQDIITVIDTDGTIRFESPAVERVLGYKPEELLGQNVVNFIHPEDREAVLEAIEQSLRDVGPQRIELRFKHLDGSWRYLEAIGQNLLHNPLVRGGVVNSRDVTERKQLEEQIRQAQKIESIGRLAGGIAHDFNNILIPIIGYVELALMNLAPDDKLYADLKLVREATDRATNLTRQILAFSRKQVLEMRVLNLNTVVTDFEKMVQRLIGEDIELQTFLDPALFPVKADEGQIEQALLNLAINARDAMPKGGKLTIETANVYLDEAYMNKHAETQAPGRFVMLAVSDTGHGMDGETQQQIFEPFFTTKAQGEGTGLGLATVFGIVRQHEGNIWVYSEPGKGATFKIYLPQAEDSTETPDTTAQKPTSLYGTETVLVVEDDEMVCKLISETLTAYGYTVIEALNAHDGLQRAAKYKEPIHLLLTDVIMPQMNGRELYQNIAAIYPDIEVLFMSGYTDNVIVHHGILDEGVNFLQKPFTVQHLTQRIRQVLS